MSDFRSTAGRAISQAFRWWSTSTEDDGTVPTDIDLGALEPGPVDHDLVAPDDELATEPDQRRREDDDEPRAR